ncbi:hypothetical protein F5J12DRAFT_786546 [Pisolithus orientalis]|uniref:uncharacterized protein n=1 Tax=Pisolithus orientalis TaxID=936130 RepID=UPI0022242438|nr:uncharacterized protein F5J12DRAFT_786546 [Pisolithus orientalis]KAI5990328.1 hypothetical protein F5J12DRAFT_786546 [Pisolithus orientalis]
MLNAPININLSVDCPTDANTLLRSMLTHYHELFHGHQISASHLLTQTLVFDSQPKAMNDPPPALHQQHCSVFLMHQEAIMSLIRLVDESQRHLSQELGSYCEHLDAIVDDQWAKLKGEQGLQSFSGSLNLMSDSSYSTDLHIGFLDHLKTASAPVLACITVVVMLHLLSNMPQNASNFLLDAVQLIVLSACEWAMTSLGGNIPLPLFCDSLQFQSWPQDLWLAIHTLNLDPELNIYACCPSCCALYLYKYQAQTLDIPEQCTARQTTGSPICNTPLLYCSSSSTGDSVPHQTFNYQPLKSQLACPLSQPGIEQSMETTTAGHPDSFISQLVCPWKHGPVCDVWDGEAFQSFKGPDGKPWLDAVSGEARLVFSLFIDWFNPYGNQISGKAKSVGAIYMHLQKQLDLPVIAVLREVWGMNAEKKASAAAPPHDPERQQVELQRGVDAIKALSRTALSRLCRGYIVALAQANNLQLPPASSGKKDYADALINWYKHNSNSEIQVPAVYPHPIVDLAEAWARGSSKTIVLGQEILTEVWADMATTTLPSWMTRPPHNLGSPGHGKLKADQWRSACLVHLVITLVCLWGHFPVGSQEKSMLDSYIALVIAVQWATRRSTSDDHVEIVNPYLHYYLTSLVEFTLTSDLAALAKPANLATKPGHVLDPSVNYCKEIELHGVKFVASVKQRKGSSIVLFEVPDCDKPKAGQITGLLYHSHINQGTYITECFAEVLQFLDLSSLEYSHDPYCQYPLLEVQLYHTQTCVRVIKASDIICHAAVTPFKSPQVQEGAYQVVLSLNRNIIISDVLVGVHLMYFHHMLGQPGCASDDDTVDEND